MAEIKQSKYMTGYINLPGLFLMVVAGAFLLLTGVFAAQAVTSQSTQVQSVQSIDSNVELNDMVQETHWRGGRKWGMRGSNGRFLKMSDEEIEERVTKMIKHVSIEIDATSEQEQQIIDVVVPAVIKMKSMSGTMRDAREEFQDLMTAETIDREALDRLRAEKLAEMDNLSREWTEVIAQVGEILTVEQRQEILEHFDSPRRWFWKKRK